MRFLAGTLTNFSTLSTLILCASLVTSTRYRSPQSSDISDFDLQSGGNHNVSTQLFAELEEFARIVDIAYCVGVTGIWEPFQCASRCSEFPGYQLVDTWNTGPLMSDSCGYIVLDHHGGRIILAFRGTYSIANTIVDLSTVPQEYVPYPGDPKPESKAQQEDGYDSPSHYSYLGRLQWPWRLFKGPRHIMEEGGRDSHDKGPRCKNCTVHSGFLRSWENTRPILVPHVQRLIQLYPKYSVHLVGHSLGGAVAALAGLEFEMLGWSPTITTFGEPRIGNLGLRRYLDSLFELENGSGRYRRITHADDPVPLLPLTEWGYLMHAGEIYIAKPALQPGIADLRRCDGDEDPNCIAGSETGAATIARAARAAEIEIEEGIQIKWGLPARYKMWQLFFAHRDYFWRLGLCVPGGDPLDWGRPGYGTGDGIDREEL